MPDSAPAVVVLVDAFRHDFLSDETTPNLAALASVGVRRPLRPILGYSDSIRATFFTGRYPDETGYWMEYCYRPESSPWTGAGRFAGLDSIPFSPFVRGAKMITSRTVMRRIARSRGLAHLDIRNMPLKAASSFDLTLRRPMTAPHALGHPTIFDECRTQRLPWAYLDASKVRRKSDLLAAVDRLPRKIGLVFIYLHQIDMAAHVFGIHSATFWRTVRSTDALLGAMLLRVRQRYGAVEPIIFSDHGMSALVRQTSIQDLLEHPAFPERFFVALDATMVRLWFHTDDERLRNEVLERVALRYPGRFLSDIDRTAYHLNFSDRLFGDEIYLLEPGIGIFPNYHSYIKPKAMHAYEPTNEDQLGIFVGPSTCKAMLSDPVKLPEITQLVMAQIRGFGT